MLEVVSRDSGRVTDDAAVQGRSEDVQRYGTKLSRYLPALEAISVALKEIEAGRALAKADIEAILRRIMPHLRTATTSERAFYADARGRIRFADPTPQ